MLEGLKSNFRVLKHKTGIFWDDHGAEIAVGAGIVSMVAGAVLVGTETPKYLKLKEKYAKEKHEAEEFFKEQPMDYSEAEYKHDQEILKSRFIVDTAKIYAKPVIAIGTGIFAIIWGTHTLKGKISALTATVTTMSEFWNSYRGRVQEAIGKEAEAEIYNNRKIKEIVNEDGSIDTIIDQSSSLTPTQLCFANFNQDGSFNGTFNTNSDKLNFGFLHNAETYFTTLLQSQATRNHISYVWMPEIYKHLRMGECPLHLRNVGWCAKLDEEGHLYSPAGGDCKVDFRIGEPEDHVSKFNLLDDGKRDYQAQTIIMDPNYDGDLTKILNNDSRNWLVL